ncbi:MAG: hypothetical protein IKD66_00030, partial [Solobacterium sp.]|nr:hypothetical protein [Solobacterium sp.]
AEYKYPLPSFTSLLLPYCTPFPFSFFYADPSGNISQSYFWQKSVSEKVFPIGRNVPKRHSNFR